jgi:hypothetical protein
MTREYHRLIPASLSTMTPTSITQRIDLLFERFNEPVIPNERIRRWLCQFPEEDRQAALLLLEKTSFHSYPRLTRETRALHALIKQQLVFDGFDQSAFSDVDFTREFTCKSGDIISYIYRKANAIPSVDFKNFDRLIAESRECPGGSCDRALVILDDYTGTGSQFIFQFIARSMDDIRVVDGYRKVYLASVVTHDNAFDKLEMLQNGECRKVLEVEEAQFPAYDWSCDEKEVYDSLCNVDWSRFAFICVEREHPLLSDKNLFVNGDEREILREFFGKYSGDSTLNTSYLAGHHAFFYGAPNSLPKILYPLFSRLEDLSIYPTEHFIGVSTEIVNWTMDDSDRPAH